ncbi:NAD-dependent epimerase/dehydratase family protein [Bacteroidota bacterium]
MIDPEKVTRLKVLVTGADGMLGNNIVRELVSRSHEVYCFIESSHSGATLKDLPVKIFKGDLTNESDIQPVMKQVDYVIHTAGIAAVWPSRSKIYWNVNVEALKLLVRFAKQYGIKRFVHIGTATSFAHGPLESPGNEDNPYTGFKYKLDYHDSKYAAQKFLLEEFRNSNFPVLILNPTFMIGKYDSGNGSNKMVLYMKKGKIPVYNEGGKNFVNVRDVADAAVNALTLGRTGECYITGNVNMTYRQAFGLIADTLEVKAPRIGLSRYVTLVFGYILRIVAFIFNRKPDLTVRMARIGTEGCYYSSNKAIEELRMPQRPIEDGIKDAVEWFEESGLIA